MPPLFESIQEVVKKHPPTDPVWSSESLRKAIAIDSSPLCIPENEKDHRFGCAVGELIRKRTLDNPEARRLFLIGIRCRSLTTLAWIREYSKHHGAQGYHEIGKALRAHGWKEDESFIQVFGWLLYFSLRDTDLPLLGAYLLSWPDAVFLSIFSGEINLTEHGGCLDSKWTSIFIDGGQSLRLASILDQIQPDKRNFLDSSAYTCLLAKEYQTFESHASNAGRAYLNKRHLRRAFELYEFLRKTRPNAYASEMHDTCIAILESADGDTQLMEAAKELIRISGVDSISPILCWFNRPPVSGPGPWTASLGGGKGLALFHATAHVGPDAFPLLESVLKKEDKELVIMCLRCWAQFSYPPTESYLAAQFAAFIADKHIDTKLRCEAIMIGAEWNVSSLESILLTSLHDENRMIREHAARALGRQGRKHLSLALEMLSSKKASSRSVAVLLLELAATPEIWDQLIEAFQQETNSGIADEMLILLRTLSCRFGIRLTDPLRAQHPTKSPKYLIKRFKFSKVPPMPRSDGDALSEFELHNLFLCQWRAGRNAVVEEIDVSISGLAPSERDALANHLMDFGTFSPNCPTWMMPMIARLCGPRTLEGGLHPYWWSFSRRRVADSLALIRVLNTEGSERAKSLLSLYKTEYPWLSQPPWPEFSQGDLFESSFS